MCDCLDKKCEEKRLEIETNSEGKMISLKCHCKARDFQKK